MLPIALLIPFVGSGLLFLWRPASRRARNLYTFAVTLLTSAAVLALVCSGRDASFTLLRVSDVLTISFRLDGLGRVFAGMIAFLWPLSTLYAFAYMEKEGQENAFFGFYTLSYGVTLGIALAEDLMTLYIFYELLTLSTLFLVTHGMSARSVYAGRKYAYFSLGGAALAFLSMAAVGWYGGTTDFMPGGIPALASAPRGMMLTIFVLGFFGFGVKAAVFPLYSWLPTASVAPTPVTALLHAVAVVKAGVFAIMRLAYGSFGADLLRGSWAQTICLAVAIFTIVFGSAMAVREPHMKRRFAYSTVSNLSYILLGVLLLTPEGLAAGLLHMLYHALMKIVLFFCVGAIMLYTGKRYVQQMSGLVKSMPFICAVYTFCAVSLVGIPPFVGFQSKWALGAAAIHAATPLGVVGLCALLISAMLTALYALVPSVKMLFQPPAPGDDVTPRDPDWRMRAPLCLLCAVMLALVFVSEPLQRALMDVAAGLQ